MKKWMRDLARYVILTVITVVAVGVMVWVSMRDDAATRARQQVTAPVPVVAQPKPLVAAERVKPSLHEITSVFSGKIRPWETYSVGFELAGRIVELGVDKSGQPLDDGSRVQAGQMLARLDDRILRARVAEASAQLEQASSDVTRARQARQGEFGAITEAEFQEALTAHALAKAALEIANENLQDSVLRAPVDATVARRMAEPGESVSANDTVFELVQTDDVLLVVDVPESQIVELQERYLAVERVQASPNEGDPESQVFRARVTLESRDRFGETTPPIDAVVYRIAELADARTGLFEVEIRVPNENRQLRPGMVATAEVVVDRISAYKVPEPAVLFRGEETYLFKLAEKQEPLQVMFWNIDNVPLETAVRVPLTQWIDQGSYLLLPSTSVELDRVIVRGQQRLSDGQHVRVTSTAGDGEQQQQYLTGQESEDRTVAHRGADDGIEQ